MSMKNPPTPAGIEPATFQFVSQCLNHCSTAVLDCLKEQLMHCEFTELVGNLLMYYVEYCKAGTEQVAKQLSIPDRKIFSKSSQHQDWPMGPTGFHCSSGMNMTIPLIF